MDFQPILYGVAEPGRRLRRSALAFSGMAPPSAACRCAVRNAKMPHSCRPCRTILPAAESGNFSFNDLFIRGMSAQPFDDEPSRLPKHLHLHRVLGSRGGAWGISGFRQGQRFEDVRSCLCHRPRKLWLRRRALQWPVALSARLSRAQGLATYYFGVTHPSLPNYLAMIAGDEFGIRDNKPSGVVRVRRVSQLKSCGGDDFAPRLHG
jgi:hypothetical protein